MVVTAVQRVQILCQTLLSNLYSELDIFLCKGQVSSTLLVHLTLSTDYLTTNEFLSNIPKKGIPTLDRTHKIPLLFLCMYKLQGDTAAQGFYMKFLY